MKAVRIHRFGPPEVVDVEEIPTPTPGKGEVLVRVIAAGVAPWDAIIREGKSEVSPQPPLTLGSDLSGIIESIGPDVSGFAVGDKIYGVTNPQFCGAQADYAVASTAMIAPKPRNLNYREAASAPVVAVTAWQMLFEYAQAKNGDTVIITGAAGNVGAYAVQLALHHGIRVVAVARPHDKAFLRTLGVEKIVDSGLEKFEAELPQVDAVLDLVGGSPVGGSIVPHIIGAIKPKGKLVSVVSQQPTPQRNYIQSVFFYAEVTTQRLHTLTDLFERGIISPQVGSVLPMSQARHAHEMLAGAPHAKGKIVLDVATESNGR